MYFPFNWRPKAPDFGSQMIQTICGGFLGGATYPWAPTATVNVYIPIPRRTFWVENCGFESPIGVGAGSGTMTLQLVRRNNQGTPVDVPLSVVQSALAAAIPAEGNFTIPFLASVTNAQRTMSPGDTLRWALVASGTTVTQPQLTSWVELSLMS